MKPVICPTFEAEMSGVPLWHTVLCIADRRVPVASSAIAATVKLSAPIVSPAFKTIVTKSHCVSILNCVVYRYGNLSHVVAHHSMSKQSRNSIEPRTRCQTMMNDDKDGGNDENNNDDE